MKHTSPGTIEALGLSHPAGVRGLKHVLRGVGAALVVCRTPQGCVD